MRPRIVFVLYAGIALLQGLAVSAAERREAAPERAATAEASTPTQAINFLALAAEEKADKVGPEHFVRNWLILGPFAYESGKVGGVQDQGAAKVEFVKDEANLQPKPGAEVDGKKWRRFDNPKFLSQYIDLDAVFGETDYAAAYAACIVEAPKELADLALLTGSDDYLTVWINGKQVFHYDKARRKAEPDADRTKDVALKQGPNVVLVKCTDVVIHWGFYLRFADAQGNPIRVLDKPPAQ